MWDPRYTRLLYLYFLTLKFNSYRVLTKWERRTELRSVLLYFTLLVKNFLNLEKFLL